VRGFERYKKWIRKKDGHEVFLRCARLDCFPEKFAYMVGEEGRNPESSHKGQFTLGSGQVRG
jgi:hypothetical protein